MVKKILILCSVGSLVFSAAESTKTSKVCSEWDTQTLDIVTTVKPLQELIIGYMGRFEFYLEGTVSAIDYFGKAHAYHKQLQETYSNASFNEIYTALSHVGTERKIHCSTNNNEIEALYELNHIKIQNHKTGALKTFKTSNAVNKVKRIMFLKNNRELGVETDTQFEVWDINSEKLTYAISISPLAHRIRLSPDVSCTAYTQNMRCDIVFKDINNNYITQIPFTNYVSSVPDSTKLMHFLAAFEFSRDGNNFAIVVSSRCANKHQKEILLTYKKITNPLIK